jgi:hypothetical protein
VVAAEAGGSERDLTAAAPRSYRGPVAISRSFGGSYAGPEFPDATLLDPGAQGGPDPRAPRPPIGPVAGISRRHVAFAIGAVVVAWIVLVFARAVMDSSAATDRVGALRDETVALEAQLEASRRELELIRDPRFIAQQARAYGMGETGERAFALPAGAPAAPSIRPLGAGADDERPSAPLEAWLDLLFGSR